MTLYDTEYGEIRRDEDVCKDDYRRLVTYDQPGGGAIILQRAAMRSFQLSEEAFGRKLWRPGMPKKVTQRIDSEVWGTSRTGTRTFRPIYLTGSIRSCDAAERFYAMNGRDGNPPNRYAPPWVSLHPHGLAIDVNTGWLSRLIRNILLNHGWKQSRPDSEPWHFSFWLAA
jgi:hypothetical protein